MRHQKNVTNFLSEPRMTQSSFLKERYVALRLILWMTFKFSPQIFCTWFYVELVCGTLSPNASTNNKFFGLYRNQSDGTSTALSLSYWAVHSLDLTTL